MPTLVISIDGAVIKEVQLTKERTTLGRRPYNDIVIENLAVSGEHAVLTISGGKVSIEDLRSTNGTYVNGRAIQKQGLLNGDLLDIGRYKIRFLDTVIADTNTPAAQGGKKALAHISEEADSGYAKLASPSGFGEISSFSSTIQGSLAALPERHACKTIVGLLVLAAEGHEAQLAGELEQLIELGFPTPPPAPQRGRRPRGFPPAGRPAGPRRPGRAARAGPSRSGCRGTSRNRRTPSP